MMCPTINEVFDCLRKKHFGSDANFDSVDGRQTKMVAHPIILHEVMNSSSNRNNDNNDFKSSVRQVKQALYLVRIQISVPSTTVRCQIGAQFFILFFFDF